MVLLLAGPLAGLAAWAAHNVLQTVPASATATAATDPTAAAGASGSSPDAIPGTGSATDTAGTGDLGTRRLVQASKARTLPATAIDRAEGPEQARTLVITAGENGIFAASLMRGAGTRLDALSAVASARTVIGAPGRKRCEMTTPWPRHCAEWSPPSSPARAWTPAGSWSSSGSALWCWKPPTARPS